jgi:hypothetical protein
MGITLLFTVTERGGLQGCEDSRIPHRFTDGDKVWAFCASQASTTSKERLLALISATSWVNPRARVQLEGSGRTGVGGRGNALISIHAWDPLAYSMAPQPTTLLYAPSIITCFGEWKNTFMAHTLHHASPLVFLQYKCQTYPVTETVSWLCHSLQNS